MNDNCNEKFFGFGFSKLALIVLALQKLKNGDLDPSRSIPLASVTNMIAENSQVDRKPKASILVMELINRIIHSQSAESSLRLAQHLFGDIDNYIANAFELFVEAGISNPECLYISSQQLALNLITPLEALNFVVFVYRECPEFFDYARANQYEYMGRSLESSNRSYDNNSSKCVFKAKRRDLSYFNGVFFSEAEDGTPGEIRVELGLNRKALSI